MQIKKPDIRPSNPRFSSGPCAKPPNWNLDSLRDADLGRSHRSKGAKNKLKEAIELTRAILELPEDYLVGIVPASDTGAIELAMWSVLGQRPITMLSWESFGSSWVTDVTKHLKLSDVTHLHAGYGALPDLRAVDMATDIVFTWNGTTSGVCVPDGSWISDAREGLTICDATSAAFAMDLPWEKLDITTFSWQKVLGGEAAHGMIVLSPRAIERFESYVPPWPLPKIFRLTKGGKLNRAIFEGATINTPSMLAVEDYLFVLNWARSIGGLKGLMTRAARNSAVIRSYVDAADWLSYLPEDPLTISATTTCLRLTHPVFLSQEEAEQRGFVKSMIGRLEDEGVAFDISSYRDAPLGLRIWTGSTVEERDLQVLCPWLDWAFKTEIAERDLRQI